MRWRAIRASLEKLRKDKSSHERAVPQEEAEQCAQRTHATECFSEQKIALEAAQADNDPVICEDPIPQEPASELPSIVRSQANESPSMTAAVPARRSFSYPEALLLRHSPGVHTYPEEKR
jgi:hypothetical protein